MREVGWWRIYPMGRMFGRDYPAGGQRQWYAVWDHGDDPTTVLGPFASEAEAVDATQAR